MLQYVLQEALVEGIRVQRERQLSVDRCPHCNVDHPRLPHAPNVCRACGRVIPSASEVVRDRYRAAYAKVTASLGTTSLRRALMLPIALGALALGIAGAIGSIVALFVAPELGGVGVSSSALLLVFAIPLTVFSLAWNRRVKAVRIAFAETVRRCGGVTGPDTFGWLRKHWPGPFPGRLHGLADRFTAAIEHGGVPILVELRPFIQPDSLSRELVVLAGVRLPDDAPSRFGDLTLLPHARRLFELGFTLELHLAGFVARGSAATIERAKREPASLAALADVCAILADLARTTAISRWS
jgi:hypothetical protein